MKLIRAVLKLIWTFLYYTIYDKVVSYWNTKTIYTTERSGPCANICYYPFTYNIYYVDFIFDILIWRSCRAQLCETSIYYMRGMGVSEKL